MGELLSIFVQEVRRRDGQEYPPGSLTSIVSGIQRHPRENGRPSILFNAELVLIS